MSATTDAATGAAPITWHWSFFLLGLVYALPAIAVTPIAPVAGLGLAIGVLPVATYNLPQLRHGRRIIPVLGAVSGVCVIVGALLAPHPYLAVAAMFGLSLAFSILARRRRAGLIGLALALPLVGTALSITRLDVALLAAVLVVAGSVYAWGVAMLWPEHGVPIPVRTEHAAASELVLYGALLGGAAAAATAIGYAFTASHVGWATGTALMVMRPVRDRFARRSIARASSVVIGALAAACFALLAPGSLATGIVVGISIAVLSATQASRWYVAPAFTTFIALTLLLQDEQAEPLASFVERLAQSAIGVGVALVFGALVPILIVRFRRRLPDPPPSNARIE